jgi:hypothetical protein
MIHSEPGPFAFLLALPSALSVREMRRRVDPLWAWQSVAYHDGQPATNAELVSLALTRYRARVAFLEDRVNGGRAYCPSTLAHARARIAHLEWRMRCIRGEPSTPA